MGIWVIIDNKNGNISKCLFETYYNREIDIWKDNIAEYYDIETLVESALKKLTIDEQEALKKWW